nr:unnamed protein product [Spirometra erinaceieuropaei]
MINPKILYSYIRQSTRNKDPVPLLRTAKGVEISDDKDKAEHLSQFFRSVVTSEPAFSSPTYEDDGTPTLEAVFFTETIFRSELLNLKESTSPGPDAIPAKLLKELASEMSKPLALIFQTSFVTGCLPSDWKSATITPLFKGGSRASANNYRPVSLTSICCKIMEKIIKKALVQFLEQHHLLSDAQHGFRSGRSCLTNLLFTLERWTKARDEGKVVHAIYIDFKKAFDSVPHQRLLYKLRNAGIRGRLLVWIQSFLAGRSQRVQVGRQQSSDVSVVSGVPQGSVFGPTLFLVFVNDCVKDLDCDAILFADDIKLWKVIHDAADADHLQANLNRLEDWSKRWLMPFNISKCNFINSAASEPPAPGPTFYTAHHCNSCVRTLVRRIYTHCSTDAEKLRERKTLWRLFLANGYPRSFVNKCLYRRYTKTDGEKKQRPEIFRVLPYVSNVSEATERMLRPLGVGVGYRPEATIRRLIMQPKDRLPPADTSGVIYRVKCLDCPANYCGMTEKRLRTRMHEHTLAVRRKDVLSHVAMHCLKNNHKFDFDGAQVLGRAESKLAREVIEAWKSDTNSINRIYRPPRRDNMADARLLEELEKFATRPDILIMGDFNAPHIDWSSTHTNSSEQTFDRSFLNTALKLFLTQHVMLPTRVREGQQANCLDLVLTKSQDSIDEVSCLPPLGPDEIPAKILKELAGELSKPLSMLFHTPFETGYLPPDWKSAWITPLYKGGSRVSANNCRPVCLTSICCKITEKIIKQQLRQFLQQNHLLSDSQHGFRKSRSCVTNLLYCLEHWTRAVDRGDMVHVIYIDFKKAFDSVPHHRLLYKLSRAGVRGKLVMWIRSFLIGSSQAVHVSDQQSAEVAVKSGVPQGSVFGPTLFLVYVNDCANELNCDVAMFADDIKIWSTIRSEVDEARLQTNLDHLEKWSNDWLLPFNVNKCNFLRVGRTSSPNHTVFRLTDKPLQEVDAQKDLGVWITTSLKPSLQCSKVAKSAMSILYLVKRAFSSFDEDCFAKVFQAFVRPHLGFAIQAWRRWTVKDFGILEKVQRRATKLVSGQWSLHYETRLANIALFPLSYRQLRGDLIQAFRIVRNQGCCLASGDFFELATTTNLRGHPLKLRVTGARPDTRKFFFSNRVVAAWNALPEDVVMSGSVATFKQKLDHHWSANHNNGGLPPP